jgi:long-chain acyl-CoA synthetase
MAVNHCDGDTPRAQAALSSGRRREPVTVAAALARAARDWPDVEALIGRHVRYAYSDLNRAVNAAAQALTSLGVVSGARIAATSANHPEIVIAFLAAQRLGAIWVGVNRNLAPPEKAFIIQHADACVVLADEAGLAQLGPIRTSMPTVRRLIGFEAGTASEWSELLTAYDGAPAPATDIDPHAPAAIAYTSGTTGFPKGVVHSQHNITLVGAVAVGQGRVRTGMRIGVALPLTILNMMILGPVSCIQAGATCICMDRIDALGLAEWVRRESIETFAAVPTMIHDLITNPAVNQADLKTLTRPGAGAAATPETFRALYRERFGAELGTSYGLTEAPTAVTMTDPDRAYLPGGSGRALPHVEVAILREDATIAPTGTSGEICVRAARSGDWAGVYTPMLGYWKDPQASAKTVRDGWLHTGDMGRLDDQGELFVEGRRNDVILRGGANVYPAEVERVLHLDERVAGCAVIGKADDRLGETVVAVIQPSQGVDAHDELRADLLALCQANLARYKIPQDWLFLADMPRNAMNKIVKQKLKALLFPD